MFASTVALGAFAQGTINGNNGSATAIRTSTNGVVIGNISGQGNYYFAILTSASYPNPILGGTNKNNLPGAWTFTGAYGTNTATAGRLSLGPATGIAAGGWGIGQTNWFEVVGWSANLTAGGPNLNSIMNQNASGLWNANGYFGISLVGFGVAGGVDPGTGQTIPALTLFGVGLNQVGGFNLDAVSPIPEPATFALAGLGAAAMLIFRRRK